MQKYTVNMCTIDDIYKTYLCRDCDNPYSMDSNFKCPKCGRQHFI